MEDDVRDSSDLVQHSRHLLAQFLEIEVHTSIVFASAAVSAGHLHERRFRNEAAAKHGYRTICHFLNKDSTIMNGSLDFDRNFSKLKSLLRALESEP